MYLRDGRRMTEHEEGAAFFEPIKGPSLGLVPPRTMGLDLDLLRRGYVPTRGVGADAAPVATAESPSVFSEPLPWLAAAAGAIGGFILWRLK